MSNTDLDSEEMAGSTADQYCSISEAMKLINQPFDGDKRKLKEFIDNVSTAFELVRPEQHGLLLKFVKTKITGEARSKLLVRDLTSTWREVRRILEENYGIKRTLDFYACRMFSSRQGVHESVASWSSRIDTMQSQLREAAFRICSEEEVIGAMGLINHLSKACFVQGLINERVQTIVRAKGETALLSTCIDCALEEESAIMSAKERGFSAQKVNRGLEVAGSMRGNPCVKMFKGSGRGSGFANREVNRENRPTHPGRGVRVDANRIANFNAHVMTGSAATRVKCFSCSEYGHVARDCKKRDKSAWRRRGNLGNEMAGRESSPSGPQ
jgi:hypothetical protein